MGVLCSKSLKKESNGKTDDYSVKNLFVGQQTFHTSEEQSKVNALKDKEIIPSFNENSSANDYNNHFQCNPVVKEIPVMSELLSSNLSDSSLKNEGSQSTVYFPTPVQEPSQKLKKDIVAETFKNLPTNLQNSRKYITELQSRLLCNLCNCHMTCGSLVYHLQGHRHLRHLSKRLGGFCGLCEVPLPYGKRSFKIHCNGRKHQNYLAN